MLHLSRWWLLATNEGYLLMGVPFRVHGHSQPLRRRGRDFLRQLNQRLSVITMFRSTDLCSEHCGVHPDHLNIRLLELRQAPSVSCVPPISVDPVSYACCDNDMSTTETAPLLQKDDAPVPSPIPKWKQYYKLTRLHLWPAGAILFFWPCSEPHSPLGYCSCLTIAPVCSVGNHHECIPVRPPSASDRHPGCRIPHWKYCSP